MVVLEKDRELQRKQLMDAKMENDRQAGTSAKYYVLCMLTRSRVGVVLSNYISLYSKEWKSHRLQYVLGPYR